MKVLVTGALGQLGYDVIGELRERGHDYTAVDINEMDITDSEAVKKTIELSNPDCVIHCAAYTAVDAAEENKELCYKINVTGTENIINVCQENNIKLIFISTDYVFDGTGTNFHLPSDKRNPINTYGFSKYQSELMIEKRLAKYFIVRTSWVFGINGNNFVKTMINLGKTKDSISVVGDQIGSPTYTLDLARLLVDMAETEKYGIYHATNEGICSWYDFACEIFRLVGNKKVSVIPVSSSEYITKAVRPKNSRMSKEKLKKNGFKRLPPWEDALERFMNQPHHVK